MTLDRQGTVAGVNDLVQAVPPQMIALLDHPADISERRKASRLASPQGIALEMRNDQIQKVLHRSRFVFEGAIGFRLTDPSASKERL